MIDCLEHNSLQQVGGYRWWEMKVTPPGAIAAVLNSKHLMVKTKQAGGKSNSFICSLADQHSTEGALWE